MAGAVSESDLQSSSSGCMSITEGPSKSDGGPFEIVRPESIENKSINEPQNSRKKRRIEKRSSAGKSSGQSKKEAAGG